jgi:hypothetical protein
LQRGPTGRKCSNVFRSGERSPAQTGWRRGEYGATPRPLRLGTVS